MGIKAIVLNKINGAIIAHRINNDPGLWTFAANTWYKMLWNCKR